MEILSEKACLIVAIKRELLAAFSIKEEVIDWDFIDRYTSGCMSIDTDITDALIEKKESWTFKEIAVVSEIIEIFQNQMQIKPDENKSMLLMAELKKDEFDLKIKQIKYDMRVEKVINYGLLLPCLLTHIHVRFSW